MTAILSSVRDLEEACEAAAAGADLIDLKEPTAGALGALAPARIIEIVSVLRARWPGTPISATIGDLPADAHAERRARVEAIARCGVDYVKAGIVPGPYARAAIDSLCGLAAAIVPVFLCDLGVDVDTIDYAARQGVAGVMVDTADKTRGSLLAHADVKALAELVAIAARHGCLSGIAGSLRLEDAPLLRRLAPDFAGFRGALCHGDRRGRFDRARLLALRQAFATLPATDAAARPASGRVPTCARYRSGNPRHA